MIWPMVIAAGTAVAVLLFDLIIPRWGAPWAVGVLGALATAGSALLVPSGRYSLLCMAAAPDRCSYVFDDIARLTAVVIAVLTALALILYVPALRANDAPAGEVGFLIACAMTGGVVLGGARDLLTLIIALETLTLPLYALVALHRKRSGAGVSGAVTFFTTSVVATAISLLGAALLHLATGTLHLPLFRADADYEPLAVAGIVLLLGGFGFKVAAVPLHAWAPSTYDGSPLPVAAYLSTASKLGGVVAILLVSFSLMDSEVGESAGIALVEPAGFTLAVLATASMLVGTLVALRQKRMVRLLAWSSVAQAGFILAPLGGLMKAADFGLLQAALAYTMFFIALEFAAFSAVAALRRPPLDGGTIDDLTGLGKVVPWRAGMLAFALIGLAGLPPTLAGLFAKVTVLQALLDVRSIWLALVVALVSVVGLAVYWRPLLALYRGTPAGSPDRPHWSSIVPLAIATAATVVLSVQPQYVLNLWP